MKNNETKFGSLLKRTELKKISGSSNVGCNGTCHIYSYCIVFFNGPVAKQCYVINHFPETCINARDSCNQTIGYTAPVQPSCTSEGLPECSF